MTRTSDLSQTFCATERLRRDIHDLCQPVTTLQCRLEMADILGTAEGYREAVRLGLEECERLTSILNRLRDAAGFATSTLGLVPERPVLIRKHA